MRQALRCAAGVLAALLLAITSTAMADKRPNILVVFCDDHASQAISAYGSKINRTPNIDRLADNGMLFNNCCVTNSICAPSRAALLTGKYSHRNRLYANEFGERFDGSQPTFPKLLQAAGYQTALIGKWHLGSDPTGFDHWSILPGQGAYYNPVFLEPTGRTRPTGYVTEIITNRTIDWLTNQRDPDKPFLLMCQHKAPHRNWEPGPKQLQLYRNVTLPEPDTLFDDYSGRGTAARQQDMEIGKTLIDGYDLKIDWTPPDLNDEQRTAWQAAYAAENQEFARLKPTGKELTRWKYQRFLKDYLRCVAAVDDSVGSLLDYLDSSGLAENTIVVYSSDQGFYLGEHGWFDKRFMYRESLTTPLIVRWPGHTPPKSTNNQIVSLLDLAETFLQAAGLPIPSDMQGKSLLPLLKGQTPSDWRTAFYYHYYEFPASHRVPHHYGIATLDHKLIHFPQLNEWELYDLRNDPNEMRSVYADPAYAATQAKLKDQLQQLQQQLGDTDPDRPIQEILKSPPPSPNGK